MTDEPTRGQLWGGGNRMSAWEAMMWRAEGDLRTRSSGVLLEILDSEPEWQRFRSAHEQASRAIPRLRDKVVEPLLPVVNPTWVPDEHFDLDYHVQRVSLPAPGTMRQLLDYVAQVHSRPLDPNRPCWEALLIGGLEGGKAAYLLKVHHAMSDGLGFMQLLELAHSKTSTPGHFGALSRPVVGRGATPLSLVADGIVDEVRGAPGALVRRTGDVLGVVGRTLRDPVGNVTKAVEFGLSLRRMMAPPETKRSPLLRDNGFGYRVLLHDIPLADLKAAGKAAGGSVNDAFVAGILGTFRLFHEHAGVHVDYLPIAIPISLRSADDPLGGNKFAGGRLPGPVGVADPAERIRLIRKFILTVRAEPAIGFLELLAPLLSRLPSAALTELAGNLTNVSDIQASNVPGVGWPVYLAGSQVLRLYPLGPRPGVAAMVTMVSYNGMCCIGFNVDPDVVPDVELFQQCVIDGFDEVVALGR
ncbi:MAG TPA: wax ester/triacylglycerol synthase domain-containing protein [Pseudonocardia sp.]